MTERLARTIFIGSAATVRSANKGIEKKRIWLGTAVPGDVTGNFDSALHLLAERATYLYTEGDRYWYDTSQSVTRTVRDIADGLIGEPEKVYREIADRLQLAADQSRSSFTGVDCCPTKTEAIPDEDRVRLVIIHPEHTYQRGDENSSAMDFARDAIRNHGNVARKHPNMLVFLAADGEKMDELMSAARDFYAWRHVHQHVGDMGLSGFEERLVGERYRRATGLFDQLLGETYCWTLVPEPAGRQQAGGADRDLDRQRDARPGRAGERPADQGRHAGRPAGAGEHQAGAAAEAIRRLGREGVDQRRRAMGPVHPLHLHAAAARPVCARERDP